MRLNWDLSNLHKDKESIKEFENNENMGLKLHK